MAPEQIQACIEACSQCADAGEVYVRLMTDGSASTSEKTTFGALRDAVAMCRITASSLARVSEASRACCEACAQLNEIAADMCAGDENKEAAQYRRALLHCAEECKRLAGGLPQAHYVA